MNSPAQTNQNTRRSKLKKSKRRGMRALIGAFLVALAAIALAACGSSGSSSSSSTASGGSTTGGGSTSASSSGETTKMAIGMNSPTYSTQMTTYVAIDEGFFAEEGIEPVSVVTAENYVAGLVGGSLQITQGDPTRCSPRHRKTRTSSCWAPTATKNSRSWRSRRGSKTSMNSKTRRSPAEKPAAATKRSSSSSSPKRASNRAK
jgi:hypothetical protein